MRYMIHHCYICDQIFESKEKLYDHLDVHSNPGQSSLSEDEIMEQFKATKSGEPSRMSGKSKK